MTTFAELSREIAEHARAYERADVTRKVAELPSVLGAGGASVGEPQARALLQSLLNPRWFDLAATAGQALVASGVATPGFLRRYAQSLIETGRYADADQALDRALAAEHGAERSELLGLKGRVDKQRYFDRKRAEGTTDVGVLRRAIDAYRHGYELDRERNTWHGVNLVACLTYAARHGLDVGAHENPREIAGEVLINLDAKQPVEVWDHASRAEASLALNDIASAIRHLRAYAEHPDASAFSLGSTLRQFEQVWELDDGHDPTGGDLLLMLRARLSEIQQGSVRLDPVALEHVRSEKAWKRLEAVFGAAKFTSLDWFRTALERCGCVARIGTDTRAGIGTGWLVRGADLAPSLGDEIVLMTNAHVIADDDPKTVSPDDALVRFQASDCVSRDTIVRVQSKMVFWSGQTELDVAVVRFASPIAKASGLRLAKQTPVVDASSRVLIIGHPEGGDLSLSINDNALLDRDDRYLHYRAPTEGGSSGSPVFNLDWRVIGLHHAGGEAVPRLNGKPGTYQANEGIRLDAIISAMRAKLT